MNPGDSVALNGMRQSMPVNVQRVGVGIGEVIEVTEDGQMCAVRFGTSVVVVATAHLVKLSRKEG